jgi:heme-degrading monooxygenase HmoA
MPILREWRAEIRRAKRDAYVEYVRTTGIAGYRRTPGNLGAVVAVRDMDSERSEIVTLSWWTSLDAIREFAGDPFDQARYYPADSEYLLTRPETVLHYDSSEIALTPDASGGERAHIA